MLCENGRYLCDQSSFLFTVLSTPICRYNRLSSLAFFRVCTLHPAVPYLTLLEWDLQDECLLCAQRIDLYIDSAWVGLAGWMPALCPEDWSLHWLCLGGTCRVNACSVPRGLISALTLLEWDLQDECLLCAQRIDLYIDSAWVGLAGWMPALCPEDWSLHWLCLSGTCRMNACSVPRGLVSTLTLLGWDLQGECLLSAQRIDLYIDSAWVGLAGWMPALCPEDWSLHWLCLGGTCRVNACSVPRGLISALTLLEWDLQDECLLCAQRIDLYIASAWVGLAGWMPALCPEDWSLHWLCLGGTCRMNACSVPRGLISTLTLLGWDLQNECLLCAQRIDLYIDSAWVGLEGWMPALCPEDWSLHWLCLSGTCRMNACSVPRGLISTLTLLEWDLKDECLLCAQRIDLCIGDHPSTRPTTLSVYLALVTYFSVGSS